MSTSASLQQAIAAKLAASFTATIGDGAATVFALNHGLGSQFVYLTVKHGAALLVNGTDFTVALTDANHITITALTGAPAAAAWEVKITLLRFDASAMGDGYIAGTLPIVSRRTKEMSAEVNAAAANQGLCIFVMPPLPGSFAQGNPFIFFDRAEIRVRIVEKPPLNTMSADAYDLVDDIAGALHWQLFSTLLAHPLQLAARPCEMVEDPQIRIIDVIFEAVYGLQPSTADTP